MNSGPNPEISVIAPFFNEAENVCPLVARILQALGSHPGGVELVLVDDCSTDATWAEILACAKTEPRLRGIRHLINRGQSAALWTGFKLSRGSILATLDGDLQNDPADFPRMIAQLASFDMVCGVRTRRADNSMRKISSRIARWARKVALRIDFADTGCNLRVFKRFVLDALPAFNGIHRFMPILARNAGARVTEIPVLHHPRVAGISKYGIWNRLGRGVRDLVMIGLFVRRQFPVINLSRPLGECGIELAPPNPAASPSKDISVAPPEPLSVRSAEPSL